MDGGLSPDKTSLRKNEETDGWLGPDSNRLISCGMVVVPEHRRVQSTTEAYLFSFVGGKFSTGAVECGSGFRPLIEWASDSLAHTTRTSALITNGGQIATEPSRLYFPRACFQAFDIQTRIQKAAESSWNSSGLIRTGFSCHTSCIYFDRTQVSTIHHRASILFLPPSS